MLSMKIIRLKYVLTIWLLLVALLLSAQEQHDVLWMEPDRPGMATGTGVMPFKKVMWETGFEAGLGNEYSILLPTTMFRFGITSFAELRVEYDGSLVRGDDKKWAYEVAPLVLGTKVRIFDGSERYKWIPKVALMANLSIPCTRKLAETNHVAPSLYALFSNEVTSWFNIGYNVGVEWDGVQAKPATFLALCLGFNITEQVGAFVESYNYITDYGKHTAADCYLDAGFTYMVHERVQLDIYAAIKARNPAAESHVGLGIAWLIK